eukprot:15432015-Alexandrium_andersonii.AAC.1
MGVRVQALVLPLLRAVGVWWTPQLAHHLLAPARCRHLGARLEEGLVELGQRLDPVLHAIADRRARLQLEAP